MNGWPSFRHGFRGDGNHSSDIQDLPPRQLPASVRSAGRIEQYRRERVHRHHLFRAENAGRQDRADEKDFLQPGRQQIAAGYALYGPQTLLVLTTGRGVHCFTLDREMGSGVLTQANMRIPEDTSEYAINASNARRWFPPVKRYFEEMQTGKGGPLKKDFNMRWVASMVTDMHRILNRGGIFMYPADERNIEQGGRIRLLYEANPMAFIVEQAGGAATNGLIPMLDVVPEKLHQRVPVFLGSKNEVDRITRYHKETR